MSLKLRAEELYQSLSELSFHDLSWTSWTWTHVLLGVLAVWTGWLLYTLYYIWARFISYQGIPKQFPFAGTEKDTWRERLRVSAKSVFGLRDLLWEGYQQVSFTSSPHQEMLVTYYGQSTPRKGGTSSSPTL
jgi:hypothetical protein